MPIPSGRGATRALPHLAMIAVLAAAIGLATTGASAATSTQWFDDTASATVTVSGQQFVDGHGRTVVLRGFNVSGEAKLAENGGLPFASVADADRSAAAMRQLTGANVIRFLITWANTEPTPGQLNTTYLQAVVNQMRPFLSRGFQVFLDFHEDLFSRYIFNSGSWYTGDGAPQWVVDAGGYPTESCGICVNWGQNITQNAAVQDATYDFWHNRVLQTSIGAVAEQDEFLSQAQGSLAYLRAHLTDAEFAQVVGFDPINEPYAGRYDSGQTSLTWERDMLWPFYLKFRARMDAAGWTAKPAFVEPNLFWNANLSFELQTGGLSNVGTLGTRYVFNTHFYDEAALSGVFMWGKAADGQYVSNFGTIRDRASTLGTAAIVSEYGSPVTGYTSDKTPTVLKAMYQALDSSVSGANWWSSPASSGTILSGTEWHWDIYNGNHHEAMNGNTSKIQTTGDAWNGEDFSTVLTDSSGVVTPRLDIKVLDRVYPSALAGTPVAFMYEDRSQDSGSTLTWNPVPSSLPNLQSVVGSGQYAVLAWRSGGDGAPTEVHLPATFTAAGTTVVSDLGTLTGLPAYTATGHTANAAVAVTGLPGSTSGQRLILTAPSTAGVLHYALITNGTAVSASVLAAAQTELKQWAANSF
ncbi:MAG TPA: cellulase family glycosylhydrolase [Rugosimonospora sp.]|nr:cellulase family glycosylhydrolase [Rugosimonospora sp.]